MSGLSPKPTQQVPLVVANDLPTYNQPGLCVGKRNKKYLLLINHLIIGEYSDEQETSLYGIGDINDQKFSTNQVRLFTFNIGSAFVKNRGLLAIQAPVKIRLKAIMISKDQLLTPAPAKATEDISGVVKLNDANKLLLPFFNP